MDGKEGGSAPPLPKRPASVSLRQKEEEMSGAPIRSPPPRPSSKPPDPPQRPTSLNSTGEQNGTVKDSSVPRLPPPPMKTRGAGNSSMTSTDNKASSARKRPEITIVSAKPMCQVGFREENPAARLPAPESNSKQENNKPGVTAMPKVPPPRPKLITSPKGELPTPPRRPTPPGRPGQLGKTTEEGIDNLIDLSEDPVISKHPVPKPRPKPAPRVQSNDSNSPNPTSGEVTPNTEPDSISTVPSPLRPTRPTIIRTRPSEAPQVAQNDDANKLPSYIKTTVSNDASVNELKAAFQKRQSGVNHPLPKPKPNIAQKPTKPGNIDNGITKAINPDVASELANDDMNTSPTPPSRRKRPTIIRPGFGVHKDADIQNAEPVQTESKKPSLPSEAPVRNTLTTSPEDQPSGVLAPTRPTPVSRKVTPSELPKSISADELRSNELSLPPRTQSDDSITPPPRKRKTGPPRPSQRPLSSSSNSETADSTEKLSKKTPPVRPPSFSSSKPASANTAPDKSPKMSEGSARRVIIHEVYPQSQAPKLPPRPGPTHPLFHYMMDRPYGLAVASNDYQSLQTDELSFSEGELLVLLKQVDDSWFYGKNGEIEGIFPANYVRVVEPLSGQGVAKHDNGARGGEAASLLLDLSADDRDTGSGPRCQADDVDTGNGPRCQARFDYEGEGQEDLVFEEGDIIEIVEHVANDWLRGRLKGRTGIFPSTFVEIIEDLPPTPADVSLAHFDGFEDFGSTTKAMFDFNGKDGELTFKTGDKITVISIVNSDWLYGETNGMMGQFPSGFISHLPPGLPKYVSPLKEQPVAESTLCSQGVEKPTVHLTETDTPGDEAYCIAIHRYPGQSEEDLSFKEADKIILLEWINEEWLKGKLENSEKVGIFPADFVTIIKELRTPPPKANPDHKTKTKVKALYDFAGENDIELNFKKGEIIEMCGDMSSSEEWREGELRGRTGLFPVSFVEELGN